MSTTADVYSHLDYTTKMESAKAISNALTCEDEDSEQTELEIDNDIEELERLLEEKREKKRRMKKDFEM